MGALTSSHWERLPDSKSSENISVPVDGGGQELIKHEGLQVAGHAPLADPRSHCSPVSRIPLPQTEVIEFNTVKVTGIVMSG